MTPRSIRRAAERRQNKLARKLGGVSEAQLTANQENAQLSTGPVTESGKAKSCLNAVKSGLTGRTVLLPSDDASRYENHLRAYENHFRPVGLVESALVQSLADTGWRLERSAALEMALYAHGRIEFAEEFEEQDPALRSALIDARTFLAYQKQLRNLQLQEARLVRRREKETAELHRLQQERLEKENHELETAAPAEIGFEISNADPQAPFATLPPIPTTQIYPELGAAA